MSWEHFLPSRLAPAPRFSPVQMASRCALGLMLLGLGSCGRKSITAPSAVDTPASAAAMKSVATAPAAETLAGPLHLEGDLGPGARWSIDAPENWNGDLVVYLHGYTDPNQPVALPAFGPIRDGLVARGYAVIASSYSENGYAVKEGVEQSHLLRGIFVSRVARPQRTYLFGPSLGGIIGMVLAEQYPAQFDGVLSLCGVVGGSVEEVQYMGDIRVLFDAVYGPVLPGGLENPPAITDLNQQVIQPVLAAINGFPQGVGIIQALARRPLPGNNAQEIGNSLVTVLVFAMQGGGDLYDRTHDHSFFDNADWHYTSPALPPAVIADINARVARYSRTPDALAELTQWASPSGALRIPMVSVHTTRDPVVPAWHEDLLAAHEDGAWLAQKLVNRYGHVQFAPAEMLGWFDALVGWVNSGQKPAL